MLPLIYIPRKSFADINPYDIRASLNLPLKEEHVLITTGETSGHLGSTIIPHYKPSQLLYDPPSPSSITLELLLASQSHLGHSTSLWNPMNSRYIFGIRQGIHIISLDVTASHLRRACKVVSGVTERAGLILFIGTRPGQDRCVVKAANLAGGCHLFERWIPGSITNGQQILGNCRLKIVDEYDREVEGYQEELLEYSTLKPDLVVCLNPLENWVALHECALNNIPTVGIIDTDANPTWVTYPIPANDDSLRCVQVIAGVLGKAGEEGHIKRRRKAANGEITYNPVEIIPIAEKDEDDR
ncbi:37S ribosomal protein, mitochondrial [Varicellaria rhodocarpa]|nr:37S ribosomal protein, mitochondrial [Varicellaria rhodocarpa]